MNKVLCAVLTTVLVLSFVSCGKASTYEDGVFTGYGDGFGGELAVTVTVAGGKITNVSVDSHSETNGIGTPAIEQLPAMIVKANSTDVDAVAGATVTGNAIIFAVNNALDPEKYSSSKKEVEVVAQVASDLYLGVGASLKGGTLNNGADNEGTPYYYLNHIFANTLFDEAGTILAITIDQMEIVTPNSRTATAPHFYGFPGQSYSYDENHDGTVDGKITVDEELFLASFLDMKTKRERGSTYAMTSGSWAEQMNAYEAMFVGMNIDDVVQWYDSYASDVNGRPLKMTGSSYEQDIQKFNALSASEQEMLVDFTSRASISLNDDHGNVLKAIVNSYQNIKPVYATKVAAHGSGITFVGRLGPGSDKNGLPVYSFNEVFVYTLFDENDRIVDIFIDQYELRTPNSSSAVNRFTGWPGETYSQDVNFDGTTYRNVAATAQTLASEMDALVTKAAQGSSYMMGSGSWDVQMSRFADVFIGMTATEVSQWFDKYCSDINGRPLKISDSSAAQDVAKFNSLSNAEQAMLVDVTSGATISLNDDHGDIIKAILKSFENKVDINVTVN